MIGLHKGLPDALRPQAAALYWQAFGGKLGRVLGPDRLALRFLQRVMLADQCFIATDPGGLIGLAGFRIGGLGFAGGTDADLRAVYGRAGAMWRGAVLHLLAAEAEGTPFLLDGICVAAAHRGRGVGSALLSAVCDEGVARGFTAIRLDVVDTNPRARALYARHGFRPDGRTQIGALRHVFGFRETHRMVRDL